MTKTSNSELRRMGRRRFFQTLSAMGISGGALAYLSQSSLADVTDDPMDEVPRLEKLRHTTIGEHQYESKPEREPVYYTIPRDEWAHIEGSLQALETISQNFSEEIGKGSVSVRVEENPGSTRNRKVIVAYRPASVASSNQPAIDEDTIKDRIPDEAAASVAEGQFKSEIDGIPVEVEEFETKDEYESTDNDYYFDSEYDSVPGGCRIDATHTAGFPAYDTDDDTSVMVVSGHAVSMSDSIDQPDSSGNKLGTVNKHIDYRPPSEEDSDQEAIFDAATVDTSEGDVMSTTNALAADGGDLRDGFISGRLGWDQIKDGINDLELEKQGITTGIQPDSSSNHDGKVRAIYTPTTDYFPPGYEEPDNPHGFDIDADREPGDSGGPHYKKDGNEIWVAGIHQGASVASFRSYATAAHTIEEAFSLVI